MNEQALRDHLLELLRGGSAHLTFDQALAGLPPEHRGRRPPGAAHSPWEVLEHLRICQWDILEFSRDPHHVSPATMEEHWPAGPEPPDAAAWKRSAAAFRADLAAMQALVADPASDLFTPFAHGTGQTPLREALLVADHNAYHLGELVLLRRLLGAWAE
ncbi:MAG: DinB family protein [Thermoanaerobaculia bacterium]